MKQLFFVISACAAALTMPAEAAVLTYNVSGIFSDGSLLSGQFSFDNMGTNFGQFSNVALTVTGVHSFTVSSYYGNTSYGGSNQSDQKIKYVFSTGSNFVALGFYADYYIGPILKAVDSTNLISGTDADFSTFYEFNGGPVIYLTNGTITPATAAVPEPASWAMFIGGFGLVGYGLRRRRTSISFA